MKLNTLKVEFERGCLPTVINNIPLQKYVIQKTNSSYGNYVIHLSKTDSKYFFLKKDAKVYLNKVLNVKN